MKEYIFGGRLRGGKSLQSCIAMIQNKEKSFLIYSQGISQLYADTILTMARQGKNITIINPLRNPWNHGIIELRTIDEFRIPEEI